MVATLLIAGSTAIRRDVHLGRVWTAYPTRVLEHSERALVLAHWPGVRVLVPTTWTAWLRGAGEAVRAEGIASLARGEWEVEPWTWHTTSWVHILLPGRWFSANAVYDDASGRLQRWYVNFQRPYRVDGQRVDTFDLLLDLEVGTDGAMRWKDEDEYEQARRLGVVTDAEALALEGARREAEALARAGGWPFEARWTAWRRDPDWEVPVLGT